MYFHQSCPYRTDNWVCWKLEYKLYQTNLLWKPRSNVVWYEDITGGEMSPCVMPGLSRGVRSGQIQCPRVSSVIINNNYYDPPGSVSRRRSRRWWWWWWWCPGVVSAPVAPPPARTSRAWSGQQDRLGQPRPRPPGELNAGSGSEPVSQLGLTCDSDYTPHYRPTQW